MVSHIKTSQSSTVLSSAHWLSKVMIVPASIAAVVTTVIAAVVTAVIAAVIKTAI